MKTLRSTPFVLMQCMFAWLMVSSVSGQGLPTVEQIYSWPLDPARPSIHNDLVEHPTNGFFYGTSASGGYLSNGLVFRMSAAGETVPLAHFTVTGPLNHGSKPVGRLALGSNGDYYGVTLEGGASGNGTVFQMGLDGELTTLVHFTRDGVSNKGARPRDGLILGHDGHFYGTTSEGGAADLGTIFRLTQAGALTTLVEFSGNGATNKGAKPHGSLALGANGRFYGTTLSGGAADLGTIYEVTLEGVLTTLVEFTGNGVTHKGASPYGSLTRVANGDFYGMTFAGGAADLGTIFRMTPLGVLTTLLEFTGNGESNKGANPYGRLSLGTDAHLYGMTSLGGTQDLGTAFQMTQAGVLTTLVNFSSNGLTNKGRAPQGSLFQAADGEFYGMTNQGGTNLSGTIFRMTSAGTLTTLLNMGNSGTRPEGSAPNGRLTLGADGEFYGMTRSGGLGFGTIFRITREGVRTTLVNFTSNGVSNKGAQPYGSLTLGPDGNFYGMTESGGTSHLGTVFQVTPEGVLTTLVNFTGNGVSNKGANPWGDLTFGDDGHLYGMTRAGGAFTFGTIFQVTTAGVLTTLVEFTGNAENHKGANPFGRLTLGPDGFFYGMTSAGGASNSGTIFKMSAAGALTTLVEFTGNGEINKGANPTGNLTLASDGDFYGMTQSGGTHGDGTLFRMTPAGALTTLVNMQQSDDFRGRNPLGSLTQWSDGLFYGFTRSGGGNSGTLFRMSPAGQRTLLVQFQGIGSDAAGGAVPTYTQLTLGPDGRLYGLTSAGGPGGGGTMLRLSLGQPDISLRGNDFEIPSGDTTPREADGTAFGSQLTAHGTIQRTFTIRNIGDMPLNLTGPAPAYVTLSGSPDFTITAQPAEPIIQPLGSATFTVTFDPTSPGIKTTSVSILNNDDNESPYTFTLSGRGLSYIIPAPQTLAFSPPARRFLDEGPLTLSAQSSSGLPVTFSLLSGPATLQGNVLTLTGRGAVKVRANQAGDADFLPAPALVRTITVLANPTVFTLVNLSQTYDGTPREVQTLGSAEAATITYKIGLQFIPQAPILPGKYSVRATAAGITKTGTLTIAKAPLFVLPDDKRKFAGQLNPALSHRYHGFLPGDTVENSISQPPTLTTTAKTASPGGIYPISASRGISSKYNFIYLKGSLQVETFASRYELLFRTNLQGRPPIAKLEVNVASSSRAFSAKLTTSTETTPISFTGELFTNVLTETATGLSRAQKASTAYEIDLRFNHASGLLTADLRRNGDLLSTAEDGQKLLLLTRGQVLSYTGAHTAVISPLDLPGHPAGAGWATASIDAKGLLKLTGRLGDGTTFTTTLAADARSHPGYRLFIQPYRPARTNSSLSGEWILQELPELPTRRYVDAAAEAQLHWVKDGRPQDPGYRDGIPQTHTFLTLDPWLPPTTAILLAQRLGLAAPGNAIRVQHSTFQSDSFPSLPTALTLQSSTFSVTAPVANTTQWKIKANPKTGSYTGSFILLDNGKKRTVPFTGVLRQLPSTDEDGILGDGLFLLPALPGSPSNEQLSGELRLEHP